MYKNLLIIIPLISIFYSYLDIMAWKYCLATVVILLTYKKIYGYFFKDIFGIQFKKQNFIPFISVFFLCAIAFNFYINVVIAKTQIVRTSPVTHLLWFIQPLFQSFNEEIFFRAQYFYHINKYIKIKMIQSLLFSIVFSLGHGVFFKFAYNIELTFNVYFALFVATLIMNYLFFMFKSIAFSWAIHFGINFSFFGGKYVSNGVKLNDPQIFNLILGDEKILIPSIIALIVFLATLAISKNDSMLDKH